MGKRTKNICISIFMAVIMILTAICPAVFVQAEEGQEIQEEVMDYKIQARNHNYANNAAPIYSYLIPLKDEEGSSDGLMSVRYGMAGEKNEYRAVLVRYYDDFCNPDLEKEDRAIPLELPLFGGFYASNKYYFILSGRNNPNQDPDRAVFNIAKYDKNWNKIGESVELKNCNTTKPFNFGTARMAAEGDYLLIRTCHEMYKSRDGYNHQANMMIQLNMETMEITSSFTGIGGSGYVSHSLNQFVRIEDDQLFAVDHGDAYGRGVLLKKYTGKISSGRYGGCGGVTMLRFKGSSFYTNASVGGFEISDTACLVVGNSIDQSTESSSKIRNIFVSTVDKEEFKAPKLHWLTTYTDGSSATTPHLVRINDNEYFVLWQRDKEVYVQKLDGNGEPIKANSDSAGSDSADNGSTDSGNAGSGSIDSDHENSDSTDNDSSNGDTRLDVPEAGTAVLLADSGSADGDTGLDVSGAGTADSDSADQDISSPVCILKNLNGNISDCAPVVVSGDSLIVWSANVNENGKQNTFFYGIDINKEILEAERIDSFVDKRPTDSYPVSKPLPEELLAADVVNGAEPEEPSDVTGGSSGGIQADSNSSGAGYLANEFTIKFNANGGTIYGSSVVRTSSWRLPYLPSVSRDGYIFEGWYTSPDGGTRVGSWTQFSQDSQLYARWKEDPSREYTVTFDVNGGTLTGSIVRNTVQHKLTELPAAERDGYIFQGWYTADGVQVTDAYQFSADVTLYAQWQKKEYTIIFDANGGTLSGGSLMVTVDQKLPYLPDAVRNGYTWNGWYDRPSSGVRVDESRVFQADSTVYAQWTAKVSVKKVTLQSVKSPSKGKLKVSWKRYSTGNGYQIAYSKYKSFPAKKTAVKNVKAANRTKTFSVMSKGKTYYVRVRAYKKVDGRKYYGSWSNVKKVTVKK